MNDQDLQREIKAMTPIQLDTVVAKGRITWVKVGLALERIAKEKLHKQWGFKTFEQYCLERHGISSGYARNIRSSALWVTESARSASAFPTAHAAEKASRKERAEMAARLLEDPGVANELAQTRTGRAVVERAARAASTVLRSRQDRIRTEDSLPRAVANFHQNIHPLLRVTREWAEQVELAMEGDLDAEDRSAVIRIAQKAIDRLHAYGVSQALEKKGGVR